ncbi:hypothetical protein AVANS14531_01135 [Campylobacter sp. Cr9]|uniref:hypothetical protein n=1 Tax=unclassified Campylobacter TaxID=2593542 RepID=UPI001EFAAD5E|nr:hypothetical protein [Campylobacter sp. RM5004]MBZ7984940.1 hypothetical protein [Campylobacter sp. Cr9]ULO02190.1 hypothetical protein AVANS_1584 [Campylobacter sp. RM5004]
MQELLENNNYKKSKFRIFTKGILEIALYVIIVFFGLFTILFSKSSIETIMVLDTRIEKLKYQIHELNKTNAQLQKDYFELLSIQGDYDN